MREKKRRRKKKSVHALLYRRANLIWKMQPKSSSVFHSLCTVWRFIHFVRSISHSILSNFILHFLWFFLFFFFALRKEEIERPDSIERYTNRGFNNYSRLLSEIVRSSRSRFSLERRNSSNYSIYKSNRRFCWTRFISHGRICFWQWFRTTEFSHGFPYYGKRYTGNGSWGAVRWASSTKSRDLEISRRNEIAWMPIHPAINKIFEKFDAKYESHERKKKKKKEKHLSFPLWTRKGNKSRRIFKVIQYLI